MSRGPGRWQRTILEAVAQHGAVVLTHPDHTPAEQNAIRRAAYVLERAGRVKLASERVGNQPRLVAHAPDAAVRVELVTGLDGKEYRRPAAPPLSIAAVLPEYSAEEVAELLKMADASEAEFDRALRLAKLDGDLSRDNILRRLRRPRRA